MSPCHGEFYNGNIFEDRHPVISFEISPGWAVVLATWGNKRAALRRLIKTTAVTDPDMLIAATTFSL